VQNCQVVPSLPSIIERSLSRGIAANVQGLGAGGASTAARTGA